MFINVFKSGTKVETVINKSEETIASDLPKSLRVEYKPNYATFDNWVRNNREHQMDALELIQKNSIG